MFEMRAIAPLQTQSNAKLTKKYKVEFLKVLNKKPKGPETTLPYNNASRIGVDGKYGIFSFCRIFLSHVCMYRIYRWFKKTTA